MSKFNDLKDKVQNLGQDQDASKVKELIQQIKKANEKDEIKEDEKESLIQEVKKKAGGNIDLGGLGL